MKLKDLLKEDSAGTTKLLKDLEIKLKGKKIKLKRGTKLRHRRFGGFGADYYYTQQGLEIPGELIPDDYKDTFAI